VGSTVKKLITVINAAGLIESYTDADGNTAKYIYNEDERLIELTDSSEAGKTKRTMHYDKTTGMLTELTDSGAGASGAGTFTATYDTAGRMTSEAYPNGMTAYYTYNAVGQRVSIEYKKLTHCTEKCTLFYDSIVPSIHGDTMRQTSTLAEEPSYGYDAVGRLTEVQEVPTGGACTTRLYAYDSEGNRDSLTTRAPGSEGKCTSEGGVTQVHLYDSANRLIDSGVKYDALGNTIALPKGDAGGSGGGEEITSGYYVDDQLYRVAQAGQTLEYSLDPAERTRETVASGNTSGTTISHYDGPGTGVAWTSESGGKWTRNITDIEGDLVEIRSSSGSAVLQLHDLRGDIVATALSSETEAKLLSNYNSTEFGVPTTGSPPSYAFRGAAGVKSELTSGTIVKDGRTYVPLTGAPLQTEQAALPLPENNIAAFTDAAPQGAAEDAAVAAAQAHAEQEFEENARAQAGAPCDEQAGPCPGEDDPEHGTNIYKCTVWSSWDGEGGVDLTGHYDCALVPQIMELQVRVWNTTTGKFIVNTTGQIKDHAHGELDGEEKESCDNEDEYAGWVYGRVWLYGKFVWSGERFHYKWQKCDLMPGQFISPSGGVEEAENSMGDPPTEDPQGGS
jgi:YD repeat-containing protein